MCCSSWSRKESDTTERLHSLTHSYDPAIVILGNYTDKTIIQKDIRTPKWIATPLTIAKTWKQPKHPSTDEQIKMVLWQTESDQQLAALCHCVLPRTLEVDSA